MEMGFGLSPNSPNSTDQCHFKVLPSSFFCKNALPKPGLLVSSLPELEVGEALEVEEEGVLPKKKNRKRGLRLKITIGSPSLKRLISGAIAGAVSRTTVAPLETIRTHLMVGTFGHSTGEVFRDIMKHEGWQGLFRGNLVNVIRVAPSKAIELFTYDTVKSQLTPKPEEQPKIHMPISLIAGAVAGIISTICTYPLELLKTRLTVQRGAISWMLS